MKKLYEAPVAELVSFDTEEVLAASINPIIDSKDNESAKNPAGGFGSVTLW